MHFQGLIPTKNKRLEPLLALLLQIHHVEQTVFKKETLDSTSTLITLLIQPLESSKSNVIQLTSFFLTRASQSDKLLPLQIQVLMIDSMVMDLLHTQISSSKETLNSAIARMSQRQLPGFTEVFFQRSMKKKMTSKVSFGPIQIKTSLLKTSTRENGSLMQTHLLATITLKPLPLFRRTFLSTSE